MKYTEYVSRREGLTQKINEDARSLAKRSQKQRVGEFNRLIKKLETTDELTAQILKIIYAENLAISNEISAFFEDDD